MQALTHCNATFMSTRTAAGQFKGQFKGAMEEMSRQGKKASIQNQPCCHGYCSLQSSPLRRNGHRHHRPASREIEVKLHRGDGGNVKDNSKCEHSPSVKQHSLEHASRTANSQFKGAMDDSSRNVQNANAHLTLCLVCAQGSGVDACVLNIP